jgi:hypothetical protein
MAYGVSLRTAALALAIAGALASQPGAAQQVRVTRLTDVAFGQINTLNDVSLTQNVSVCSSASDGGYTVRASGNGPGGAFLLTSGSNTLAYHVQWAGTTGQASGTALQANTTSPEFRSSANSLVCYFLQSTTATLIVRLAGTDTANARAGSYTGTLTILIAPN